MQSGQVLLYKTFFFSHSHFCRLPFHIQLFQKGCHRQQSILEPKGSMGTVIMSDNTPAKVVTV